MRGNTRHVDADKQDRQRSAQFGKGGTTKMAGKQAANLQKPGVAGHEVAGRAPGSAFARGGSVKSKPRTAAPAKSGATSPR